MILAYDESKDLTQSYTILQVSLGSEFLQFALGYNSVFQAQTDDSESSDALQLLRSPQYYA